MLKKEDRSNSFFPTSCYTMQNDRNECELFFKSESDAKSTLSRIKNECAEDPFNQVVIEKIIDEKLYSFRLNQSQLTLLRKNLREKANTIPPQGDFIFKSLRVDKDNYYRRFIEMVVSPINKKHPLRVGKKKKYTVTGKTVYARKKESQVDVIPIKQAQYTSSEKQGFSNFQSASLGLSDFYPMVFGFGLRGEKLVGVIFEEQDVLYSDRLYVYDGGTVTRPYDFDIWSAAKEYSNAKTNKVLFSANDIDILKRKISQPESKGTWNEVLVRLKWNLNTSKLFIASDNLEGRIWAQEYARIMKNYLIENNLCDADYTVPICYYFPDDAVLNFKEYSAAEQALDRLEAYAIYSNPKLRNQKYQDEAYEFLFLLPSEKIIEALQENLSGKKNIIFNILLRGDLHIFASLVELTGNEQLLLEILQAELKKVDNQLLIGNILSHCLRCNNEKLANFVFDNSDFINLPLIIMPEANPLTTAAEKNLPQWIEKILLNKSIDIEEKSYRKFNALELAILFGNVEAIYALVKQGANVNELDQGTSIGAIHYAAQHDIDLLIFLTANNAKLDLLDASLRTVAHYAAMGNNVQAMKYLSDKGVDLQIADQTGKTPLHYAVLYGHVDMVLWLVKHLNLDLNKIKNITHMATDENNIEILKLLVSRGVDLDQPDSEGRTPIFYAAARGNIAALSFLLDQGVDLNKFNNGMQIIHVAAEKNQVEVLQFLSDRGVDLNQADLNLNPPIYYAAKNGAPEAFIFLIDAGVDLEQTYSNGNTLAHVAAQNANIAILNILLSYGVDINKSNLEGRKPIHLAVQKGDINSLIYILEHGVALDTVDAGGNTLVHHAVFANNIKMLGIFRVNGVDLNQSNRNGQKPIHFAAMLNIDLLQELILCGVNLNVTDNKGNTPVHMAAKVGNIKALTLLLSSGIDLHTPNYQGEMPILLAAIRGHTDAFKFLLEHGGDLTQINQRLAIFAASTDDQNLLQFLSDQHVDWNILTKEGKVPINVAINNERVETFKFLIAQGVDINKADSTGCIAAHYAVQDTEVRKDILMQLAKIPNVDWYKENKKGLTPIHSAAICGNVSALAMMKNMELNLNVCNQMGRSITHFAALSANHNGVINYLSRLPGIDWSQADHSGLTPAHLAAEMSIASVSALLTIPEIDWNRVDNIGRTPAYFAAQAAAQDESSLFGDGETEIDLTLLTLLKEHEVDFYQAAITACKLNNDAVLGILTEFGINLLLAQEIGKSAEFNELYQLVMGMKERNTSDFLDFKQQSNHLFEKATTDNLKNVSKEMYVLLLEYKRKWMMKVETAQLNPTDIIRKILQTEKISHINYSGIMAILQLNQPLDVSLKEISLLASQALEANKKFPTLSSISSREEEQLIKHFYKILRDLPENKTHALERLNKLYDQLLGSERKLEGKKSIDAKSRWKQ